MKIPYVNETYGKRIMQSFWKVKALLSLYKAIEIRLDLLADTLTVPQQKISHKREKLKVRREWALENIAFLNSLYVEHVVLPEQVKITQELKKTSRVNPRFHDASTLSAKRATLAQLVSVVDDDECAASTLALEILQENH
jgi:hypothetical protein